MTNETRSLDYDYQNPTYHVHADVLPADAEDKSVNWASSDETIASVKSDATGARISLTGKSGLFNLTCTSVANPEASDTVACTVTNVLPTSITITGVPTQLVISQGVKTVSRQLAATIAPAGAHDRRITWSVDNPSIASIDSSGLLTAISPGTVTVTATCVADKSVTDSKQVEVDAVWPFKGWKSNDGGLSKIDADPTTIDSTISQTDGEIGMFQSTAPTLDPTHQYRLTVRYCLAPNATVLDSGFVHIGLVKAGIAFYSGVIDLSKVTGDWQTLSFTIGPASNLGDGYNFAATRLYTGAGKSEIQFSNLWLSDVTGGVQVTAPEATDFGAYTWSQIGLYDGGSGIVNLTEEPGKEVYQYNNNKITFMRGHLYQVSLTTKGGSVSTHLNEYWNAGVSCPASADWKTSTDTFTLPGTGEYSALICFYMPVTENGISMQMKDMRIDDLTLEAGLGGGSPVSPTP